MNPKAQRAETGPRPRGTRRPGHNVAAVEALIALGLDIQTSLTKAYATIGPANGWQSLSPAQQALVD